MGQRQDKDEIVYGDDCLLGFEEGKTPKYVYARFSKMVKCPEANYTPPNDRVFKLTQLETLPCWWCYEKNGGWIVELHLWGEPVQAELRLYHELGLEHFLDIATGGFEEGYVFHNDYQECTGECGAKEGIAVVTWQLQTIALLKALNMKALSDIFMEMRPLVDGNLVYKFCRLEDATNIAIEFEPD